MTNIGETIRWKYPFARPQTEDYEVCLDDNNTPYLRIWNLEDVTGMPIPVPTQEELLAWSQEASSAYQLIEYKDKRRAEYPPVGDQLDLIYKIVCYLTERGLDIGPDGVEWVKLIRAVKERYPK